MSHRPSVDHAGRCRCGCRQGLESDGTQGVRHTPGMSRTVLAALATLTVVTTGCGGGSSSSATSRPPPQAGRPCKSLVGHPLSEAWDSSAKKATCTDSGTGQISDSWGSAGCYPGGKYDKSTPMVYIEADDGFYFARTGEDLQFKSGTPSITQMSNAVGC